MIDSDSYVVYDAEKVFDAAWDYINDYNKMFDESVEALIDAEMKRKWFRPKTREEAYRKLNKRWDSQYYENNVKYKFYFPEVESIIMIAKLGMRNKKEVYLSTRHVKIIADYLAKEWRNEK